MSKPVKRGSKRPPRADKATAKDNLRLAQQTRKILGKHYAAKYRVR